MLGQLITVEKKKFGRKRLWLGLGTVLSFAWKNGGKITKTFPKQAQSFTATPPFSMTHKKIMGR
jgi:hypothetical protein